MVYSSDGNEYKDYVQISVFSGVAQISMTNNRSQWETENPINIASLGTCEYFIWGHSILKTLSRLSQVMSNGKGTVE